MSIQYRKAIDQIPAYEPGKPIEETERELGIKVFAKLASNESAAGVSPAVVEAIRQAASQVFLYPDANCFYLVRELAERYHQPENRIIVSAGSEDIIDLIAKAYIEPGDEVIMSQYAFVRYPMVVRMMEAHPVFIPTLHDMTDDFESMVKAITPKTKAIILANPNNPIGTYVNRSTLEAGLSRIPNHVMVVMDDAYAEYAGAEDYPDTIALQKIYSNIISLRTFSKIYGLAGLRIGYG
ncbi:MAG: aminotransferase class I/II-fold pyridoxal phosphate-dependent enzyme, partial [Candidatus Delongbacteria bacterium]|nr:aminotransferase class I/II-fold pyridoxal phosphate-dependent enzyme [Candidatus Delongbacteria bacterium]